MEILGFAPNLVAIFIFVLIVSGNYLGELFPCKVQQIFNNNMYVKHTLGFLTLLFFVTLTIPELKEQDNFLGYTTIIYLWFVMMAKCYYTLWFVVFGLVGILYVMEMYKGHTEKKDGEEGSEDLNLLKTVERIIMVTTFLLTILGFLIYMGAKKREYGKKFSYIQFIFGMPSCKDNSPRFPGYLTLLKHAFD